MTRTEGAPTPTPDEQCPVNYMPMATTTIGVLGAILVAVLSHKLSKRREAVSRSAGASAKFRGEIETVLGSIPPVGDRWSDNVLAVLPSAIKRIGIAVEEFKPFVTGEKCSEFDLQWQAMKRHCEDEMPHALSTAQILYGGGPPAARAAKEKFYEEVKKLLLYARQT